MSTPRTTPPKAVPFGQDCVILDVRTGVEHKGLSLKQPHQHIPLGDFNARDFLEKNKVSATTAIYTLCRSGKRATQAASALIAAGHENVYVIDGGIIACEADGIPVRQGSVMSLERQVRIAAGLLVILGVALGTYFSPWFYMLSGFVGCGLVFAGITDCCGMALLLAKCPWNQIPAATSCCAMPATCSTQAAPADKSAHDDATETVTFYSPASGKPTPVRVHELTKTSGSSGGCS